MGSRAKAPTPPSPGQVAQQTLEAQLAGLPFQLQAERQFGPQFAQTQFDLLERFAPQVLEQQLGLQQEFGPQFAEQQVAEREILAPEAIAGQRAVTGFLEGAPTERFQEVTEEALQDFLSGEDPLSEAQRENLQEAIREAQNVRGFGIASPLGSLEEARQLEELRQNVRRQRLETTLGVAGSQLGAAQNLATTGLSAAGRVPVGLQQFGAAVPVGGPQLTQQLTPGQFQQAGQFQFGALSQQAAEQNALRSQRLGALGGALGGAAGAFFGVPGLGAQAGAGIGGLV